MPANTPELDLRQNHEIRHQPTVYVAYDFSILNARARERERERDKTRQDKIILLSGLRPITTGVNIQAIRILMDPTTDLNSVF